jgi:hypothetical protein
MGIDHGNGDEAPREVIHIRDAREMDTHRNCQWDWPSFIDTERMTVTRVPRGTLLTTLMGGNTFQMFQSFGGLDLRWLEVGDYGMKKCLPFSRAECERLIQTMTTWLASDQAEAQMREVRTDRRYVQSKIDQFAKLLAPHPDQAPTHPFNKWRFLTVERFHDDDRELDEMCELADDYADRYWGECADH